MICSDCRVVRDPQTLKSKGYGFVSFAKKTVSIFKFQLSKYLRFELYSLRNRDQSSNNYIRSFFTFSKSTAPVLHNK